MSLTSLIPDGSNVVEVLGVYHNGARVSPPCDRSEATRIAATAIYNEELPKLFKRVKAKKVRTEFPALAIIAENISACDIRKDSETIYKEFQALAFGLRQYNKEAGRDGAIQFRTVVIDNWNKF